MALTAEALICSDTALAVFTPDAGARWCMVRNAGDQVVFVGGSDVVPTEGYPLYPGESVRFTAKGVTDVLWALTAGAEVEVRVLHD